MLTRGILWMNQRNNIYVKEFNPDRGIRLANNKEQTKKFLSQRSIPVPRTFFHIRNRQDWFDFDPSTLPHGITTFVIKPNNGSKWQGIFIINEYRKRTKTYKKKTFSLYEHLQQKLKLYGKEIVDYGYEFRIGKKRISEIQLKKKTGWIFQWLYSSAGKPDTLLIEDKLIPWNWFEIFCEHGLADMRIIMFNLVPVIAMLRVPTEQSGGKANLAQGWIGLGIDIVTGKINSLYRQGQSYTTSFPIEWSQFKNKKIPYRQEILEYSANAQYFVNSGYLGMDWVVTTKWPKLLEINARAGLEIQNITGKPLLHIMKKIEDLHVTSPSKWLEISRSLFGSDKTLDNKPKNTIYLSQSGKLIYQRDYKKRALPVTVSVGFDKTRNYASEKIIKKMIGVKNISVDVWSSTKIIDNILLYPSSTLYGNKIVLWQRTLSEYYIIPRHKSKVTIKNIRKDYIDTDEVISLTLLDEKINNINKQLNLSKLLKPINYLDEFDKFVAKSGNYNPQFLYNFPTYKNLRSIEEELKQIDIKYRQKDYFESDFAQLFFDKIDELYHKINLIRAYKKQDLKNIEYYNILIFWNLQEDSIEKSKIKVLNRNPKIIQINSPIIDWNEVLERFQQYITQNKIQWVRLKIDDSILSWISVWLWKHATIKIKSTLQMKEYKVEGKIAHEIEIHVMRYLNGKKTWWNILTTWTAWYIVTEEGLAVYTSDNILQHLIPWYDSIAKYENYDRLYQSKYLNFAQMAHYIATTPWWANKRYKSLFNSILKTKKWLKDTSQTNTGIIFWKNAVYLNWYNLIKELTDEDRARLLLIWKIKIEDLTYFK